MKRAVWLLSLTCCLAATPVLAAELAVVGGDLVDVGAMAPRHRLSADLVLASAVSADTAYLWTRPRGGGIGGEAIQAHDVTTGALRWSMKTGGCWRLAALPIGAVCGTDRGAVLFRRERGEAVPLGARTGVSGVMTLRSRLLVLHEGRTLEVFDETGGAAGRVTVPVSPDGGYSRQALEPAGPLACGAQRSDAGTTVFCVDASATPSPRVVWTRRLPVQGGLLVQVDEQVLVVASDSWARRGSGAVLRASDGAVLLRTPFRPAAALTSAGQLEAVLATTREAVVLHEPGGALRWRWTGPGPHHRMALRALRVGANVLVAPYNPIATGTALVALDAASGRLAWTATVASLSIGHSKYSNRITLEARPGGLVLLRGHESGQDYLQTFDAATGKRTAEVLRGR